MMSKSYTTTGVVSNSQTLILDEPLPALSGRVQITIEPLPDFWQGATLAELARMQNVQPVQQLEDLWGDFWPEDESIDDFVATIRRWRHEPTTDSRLSTIAPC